MFTASLPPLQKLWAELGVESPQQLAAKVRERLGSSSTNDTEDIGDATDDDDDKSVLGTLPINQASQDTRSTSSPSSMGSDPMISQPNVKLKKLQVWNSYGDFCYNPLPLEITPVHTEVEEAGGKTCKSIISPRKSDNSGRVSPVKIKISKTKSVARKEKTKKARRSRAITAGSDQSGESSEDEGGPVFQTGYPSEYIIPASSGGSSDDEGEPIAKPSLHCPAASGERSRRTVSKASCPPEPETACSSDDSSDSASSTPAKPEYSVSVELRYSDADSDAGAEILEDIPSDADSPEPDHGPSSKASSIHEPDNSELFRNSLSLENGLVSKASSIHDPDDCVSMRGNLSSDRGSGSKASSMHVPGTASDLLGGSPFGEGCPGAGTTATYESRNILSVGGSQNIQYCPSSRTSSVHEPVSLISFSGSFTTTREPSPESNSSHELGYPVRSTACADRDNARVRDAQEKDSSASLQSLLIRPENTRSSTDIQHSTQASLSHNKASILSLTFEVPYHLEF